MGIFLSPHHLSGHWDAPNSYTGYHKFQEKHNLTSEITSKFFIFSKFFFRNYKYFFLQVFTEFPPAVVSLNYCTLREAVHAVLADFFPFWEFPRGFLFIFLISPEGSAKLRWTRRGISYFKASVVQWEDTQLHASMTWALDSGQPKREAFRFWRALHESARD